MRRVRRAAALAALLPCLFGGLMPTAASAAPDAAPEAVTPDAPRKAAADRAPQRGREQVGLVLTKVPGLVRPKSKITIQGSVENRSGQAMPGLTVQLRYSSNRITSRSQLDEYAASSPGNLSGAPTNAVRPLPMATVPGGTATWKAQLDPSVMGLSQFGVYPVGVEVRNSAQQVVAGVTTFITYYPKTDLKKVKVSWVWPVADKMHRANDTTFLNDTLARDLADGGRLDGLAKAPGKAGVPVTWAVDPALLDDVNAMNAEDGYQVKTPLADVKTTVRRPRNPAAGAWLNTLKGQLKSPSNPYFALPYADPDVVALTRYEFSRQLDSAYQNTSVATQLLGKEPTAHIAWPTAGVAGPMTLSAMASRDLKSADGTFLLSERMFEPQQITGNAVTRVQTRQGVKSALVYDEKLNNIVSADVRAPGAATLMQQRFVAETAMIAQEAPGDPNRSLVIAPDRTWAPSPVYAETLLKYSRAPWLSPTPLSTLQKAKARPRVYQNYPDEYERYELGHKYLTEVDAISKRTRSLNSILVQPSVVNYDRALLRMQSSSWRGHSTRAQRTREELARELDRDINKVRIISQKATLGGRDGRIPVTVVNDFPKDQKVIFRPVVASDNPYKLQVSQPEEQRIEMKGGDKKILWIPVRALGNGTHKLKISLMSEDGKHRYDVPAVVQIHATGYAWTALLITGGGLAVLFVGVGVRAIRARRRRKAEAAGDGSTGMGPTATGPLEPGEPGAGSAGFWPTGPTGPAPAEPVPGAPAEPSAAPVPGSANGSSASPGPADDAAPRGRHRGGDGG